jgi:DNA-binding XRE family transcriptional regulator
MTGKQFESIRRELCLNQDQLAEVLEVNRSTIVNIENREKVSKVHELAIKMLKVESNRLDD